MGIVMFCNNLGGGFGLLPVETIWKGRVKYPKKYANVLYPQDWLGNIGMILLNGNVVVRCLSICKCKMSMYLDPYTLIILSIYLLIDVCGFIFVLSSHPFASLYVWVKNWGKLSMEFPQAIFMLLLHFKANHCHDAGIWSKIIISLMAVLPCLPVAWRSIGWWIGII